MAFYADKNNVNLSNKPDQYNMLRSPGETPPAPGIYKCQKCGFEDVINRDCDTLPPCANCDKSMKWKMLVKATDK